MVIALRRLREKTRINSQWFAECGPRPASFPVGNVCQAQFHVARAVCRHHRVFQRGGVQSGAVTPGAGSTGPWHRERPTGEGKERVTDSNPVSVKSTLRAKALPLRKGLISHFMSEVVSCLFLPYFTEVSFCTGLEMFYMPTSPST